MFSKKWEEVTAKFDQNTKWENGEKGSYPPDAATVAIVQMLHEGSKIEVVASKTDPDQRWTLMSLELLPTGKVSVEKN